MRARVLIIGISIEASWLAIGIACTQPQIRSTRDLDSGIDSGVHADTGAADAGQQVDSGVADAGQHRDDLLDSGDGLLRDAGSDAGEGTGSTDRPVELALGAKHSCVRTEAGRVFCWGLAEAGILGDGNSNPDERCTLLNDVSAVPCSSKPVLVADLPAVSQLSVGSRTTCAVHARRPNFRGNLSCWGEALGNEVSTTTPHPIFHASVALNDAIGVRVGGSHACVLRADELPVCWGHNFFGQLGTGTSAHGIIEPTVANSLGKVTVEGKIRDLALGQSHSCALLTSGSVVCWGNNLTGEAGQPEGESPILMPAAVSESASIDGVVARGLHTCLLSDGKASCFGYGADGVLGSGPNGTVPCDVATCAFEPLPVLASAVSVSGVAQLATGYYIGCARFVDGVLACWGSNYWGELGPDQASSASDTPTRTFHMDVVTVATGDNHACAILPDDSVVCWGLNDGGQLGAPSAGLPYSKDPVTVPLEL
jgi:alpha-tubulin suppressor-like RCC1 family protein